MKDGKPLERLIEYLESALVSDESVEIIAPFNIPDRITGKPREFDVVIRTKTGHHESLIAIECRDRSRKVTVNEVEAFWKKCEDAGVRERVIVSRTGFYKTALKKASYEKIRCLELHQVKSAAHKSAISFGKKQYRTKWKILDVQMKWIADDEVDAGKRDYTIIDQSGIPFAEAWQEMFRERWNSFSPDISGVGIQNTTFTFDVETLHLIDRETQVVINLRQIVADVTYQVTRLERPVEFFDYVDRISGKTITNIAIMDDQPLGDMNYKLLAIQTDNNTMTFSFVPKDVPT